jgi:hypothetical protein
VLENFENALYIKNLTIHQIIKLLSLNLN